MVNNTLDKIKATVAGPLETVHKVYADHLHSQVPLLQEVNNYLSAQKGKELRILLVLLSASAASGNAEAITSKTINYAAAMEMLHNASLMHDDVVDNSPIRRGRHSVKQRWNNQLAVLCGDYYLAQVMRLLKASDEKHALDIVCNTVIEMSEGEVLQQQYIMSANSSLQPQGDTYYEILRRKTASLMAACCELGDPTMRTFGEHYGMAFQLWDDINDYSEDAELPKPPSDELFVQKNKHMAAAKDALSTLPPSKYKDAITSLLEILNL